MRFNRSQRSGLARLLDNLASGFAAVSIIGYMGFGIKPVLAIIVFVLAVLCVVGGLAIRNQKACDDN